MSLLPIWVLCALLAGILLSIEIGYQTGRRRWPRLPEGIHSIAGPIEASVFGLMGLLVTFTFYGAASRFDARRNLIVQEANAIGTAYLRLDLIGLEGQPQLREDFRQYARSRLAVSKKMPDIEAVNAELAHCASLQNEIWRQAVEGAKASGMPAQTLLLPAINQMIDITTAATVALTTHPPPLVFAMLAFAVAVSCVLAGYGMSTSATRDWVPIITFVLVLSAALYTIIDYEYPRIGIVRIDPFDRVLMETLDKMK
jgi:hypothetical protein